MSVKDSTTRDYRERVNRVIFHVERHLGEPLHLEELARVAEPAGWRLGEPEGAASEDAPADGVSESQSGSGQGKAENAPSGGVSEPQGAPEEGAGGVGQATPEQPTGALWKLGAVAAGFGALVFVARKWG